MISVIIPTKNAGAPFRDTLEAIRAQDIREQVEIVVIDSGSTDGTPELAASYGARVERIRPEEFNHGLTRNRAIRLSKGELVVLTVQDAIPFDGLWLTALADAARSDPKVAGAYSRHIPHRHANQFTKQRVSRGVPGRPNRVVQSAELIPRGKTLPAAEMYLHYCFNNVSSIMKRPVWEKFPLRDVGFGEDIDWSKRVIDAGYKIVYEPGSMIYHSHERPLSEEFKRGYVTEKAYLDILGCEPSRDPFNTLVDMAKVVSLSLRFLGNPYINTVGGRLYNTVYALSHSMVCFWGMRLGDYSRRLGRYGWFKPLDARLSRGL